METKQVDYRLCLDDSAKLKGIAIVLIIISHVAGMFQIRYFTPCGGIGVALFLFVAGYGLSESFDRNGLKNFWKKRLIVVLVPYFMVEILAVVIIPQRNAVSVIKSLLLIEPRKSQIWYLQYLFLCYICFWCTYKFVSKKYRLLILLMLAILSFFLLKEIAAEQALSFWCGCLFSEKKGLFEKLHRVSVVLLLFGVIMLAFKQLDLVRNASPIIINCVQLSIKLPIALYLVDMVTQMPTIMKYLYMEKIGKVSYELYLIHINFLYLVRANIWSLMLFVVLTTVGAVMLHLIVIRINRNLMKDRNVKGTRAV